MRPAPGLLLLVAACAGCASPRAERPLGPAVNLVMEDERPASRTEQGGFLDPVLIYVLPFVPWFCLWDDPLPQRSLTPEVKRALEETGLFERVLGPGDPWPARLEAPFTLRVTLVESVQRSRRTAYGLGVVGLLLQALGAPQEYETTSLALRATCASSDGRVLCEGEGSDGEVGLTWLYERSYGEREADLRHAARVALSEALAPLLEPD